VNITIIGTGYVGLVSGVCLAAKNHRVTCVDNNLNIVNKLNRGIPTIHEKGLHDLLNKAIKSNLFYATNNLTNGLNSADTIIVAVGTPSHNGIIDLSYILDVSKAIGQFIKTSQKKISVIIKSTVIPGTTDTQIKNAIEEASGKKLGDFGLGMNPEFLREGNAIDDFMYPDRIIFGYQDLYTLEILEKIYSPWKCEKVCVNTRTAEMIKYTNNTLLATQISTINEIANLASKLGGIDMLEVFDGVSLDKRWNPIVNNIRSNPKILTYLIPGCGFGGSCFPKDLQALRSQGEQNGLPMEILNAILSVNNKQPYQISKIIEEKIGNLLNKRILVLGLAFKADTDDVRESPSLKIIPDLLSKNAIVTAHDPIAIENFKLAIGNISSKIIFKNEWESCISDADVIIISTSWNDYKNICNYDLERKIIFDARRLLSHKNLKGGIYLSIGYN